MMPFPAASLRSPVSGGGGGGSSYPMALTMTRSSPTSTSDLTGWTQTLGSGFAAVSESGLIGYRPGNHTTEPMPEIAADYIDFPSDAYTDIDNGEVTLSLPFKQWDSNANNGRGLVRLTFHSGANGSGSGLGSTFTSLMEDANGAWADRSLTYPVPSGARSVRIIVDHWPLGTNWYVTDFQPSLTKPGTKNEVLYTDGAGSDTSGWTVVSGSGQPGANATWSPWRFPGIYGGSQASGAHSKTLTPSAAALTAIAAGSATLHLQRHAINENGDDRSRTFVECLDASNAVVATLQDAAVTTDWNTLPGDFFSGSVAIPSTTTTFRINHQWTRVDGTVLDALVCFCDVRVTW